MTVIGARALKQLREERDWNWAQYQKAVKARKLAEAVATDALAKAQRTSAEAAAEALGHEVAKQRHEQLLSWVKLNRPELLKLQRAVESAAAWNAANQMPSVAISITERKRLPKIHGATRGHR